MSLRHLIISLLHRTTNGIGDVVIGSWQSLTVALLVSAGVLAMVIVGLFRLVGRAENIRRSRNRLLARTLELLLFGHEGRGLLTASGRILAANAVYLWQFVVPLCVSAVPVTLLLIEGAAWFAHRPFRVGEPIIVEVTLAPDQPVLDAPVRLSTAGCLTPTAGPIRIPGQNELCYRLVGTEPGEGWVEAQLRGHVIRKQIAIGERLERLATERRKAQDWESLLHPGEWPIPGGSHIAQISTLYPRRTWNWGLTEYDAGVVGVLLTLVLSLVVARLFRVSLV